MSQIHYTTPHGIEIEPKISAKKTIIWLHGLGADGSDFVPFVPELNLPDNLAIRYIFPHAPLMPVTISNGYTMRAWYDIASIMLTEAIDEQGIHRSIAYIDSLIEREASRGVSPENILLGGFSQGAVIALTTGILHKQTLGGVIALSGYLPLAEKIIEKANNTNKHVPIFIGHGTHDPVVPYILGQTAYTHLKQHDYKVSFHSYTIAHTVSPVEITDIQRWIQHIWHE